MGYIRADGSVDNTAAIQWWLAKLFESTHLRYRLNARWSKLRRRSVPPSTLWIHTHIEFLARLEAESTFHGTIERTR